MHKLQVDGKTSFFHSKVPNVKLPPVFAHQWVRTCIAVNSESNLLHWVVDGTLVDNSTAPRVKKKISETNQPT